MLTLLPVFLLMLTAVGVLVFQRARSGFGVTWLISAAVSLVAWVLILIYHWLVPPAYSIENWLPFVSIKNPLEYTWDPLAWPFGFSMAAVLLAVLWSSPARFKIKSDPGGYFGNAIGAAAGLGFYRSF
jgi:formate hydrogenlyase subunit 3/multisubunit Na+/H+ antiporter MnhD subunit